MITKTALARYPWIRVRTGHIANVLTRELPHFIDVKETGSFFPPYVPDCVETKPFSHGTGREWLKPIQWCEENIGPSAVLGTMTFKGKPYARFDQHNKRWANYYGRFFFGNPNDAVWFKLVWY
jgi:hypothetical protein